MKRWIKAATYNGFDESEFDYLQMEQIRKGLESGVDVSVYADPKFSYGQMKRIRDGLESGVDVSIYADPKFSAWQMEELRLGLESGVDVSVYAVPEFGSWQMEDIRKGLEKYSNDPMLHEVDPLAIADAYQKGYPSLAYAVGNRNQRAKLNWQAVKDAAADPSAYIPEIEEQFDLGSLEGRAAYTLGLTFEENPDNSVTFFNKNGYEVGTIDSQEYDMLVRTAITRSSTRQSFAKAFATQLKHALDL